MARLIRMDGTGHTTLAEWTAADDAAFAEALEEFSSQLDLGYIGTVPDGPGKAVSFVSGFLSGGEQSKGRRGRGGGRRAGRRRRR